MLTQPNSSVVQLWTCCRRCWDGRGSLEARPVNGRLLAQSDGVKQLRRSGFREARALTVQSTTDGPNSHEIRRRCLDLTNRLLIVVAHYIDKKLISIERQPAGVIRPSPVAVGCRHSRAARA
jgi:hypothetical protein